MALPCLSKLALVNLRNRRSLNSMLVCRRIARSRIFALGLMSRIRGCIGMGIPTLSTSFTIRCRTSRARTTDLSSSSWSKIPGDSVFNFMESRVILGRTTVLVNRIFICALTVMAISAVRVSFAEEEFSITDSPIWPASENVMPPIEGGRNLITGDWIVLKKSDSLWSG